MRKLKLLLACFLMASIGWVSAQNKTVSGTVVSAEDGQPIIGAKVVVKGTTSGTITNADGKFSFSVPNSASTLVVSFVGMKAQEANAGTNLLVQLIPEEKQLEEVVVTAFGIKRNPREMGVSTVKVSDKELTGGGVTNVTNGLTGKVSGLQINTINNGVNPDTKITLRGNRHFLASNQALIVLDGVPVNATYLSSINPNDIENVNILKGASAAALYGNDASNGVLIITTKKETKKPTIKISNTTTFERISYLPKLQTRFGSGSGESVGSNDPNYTFWIGPDRNTDPYTSYENQSYGPEFNGQMVILGGKLADGSYQMIPYSAVPNQKLNFFNTGITSQSDISYSAGDDKSHFYLSVQDVTTSGTVPDDKNRRTGVRMSAGKAYGIFATDFTFSFVQINTNTSGGDMYQQRGVYWNVLNTPAHVPLTRYKDIVNNPFATLDGYFNAYYPNPYWQIAHSRNKDKKNDALGSVSFNLNPFKWLELTDRVGLVYEGEMYDTYRDQAVYSKYSNSDPWGGGHMGVSSPYIGVSSNQMLSTMSLSNDFLAKFSKNINDFSAKLILGTTLYSYQQQYMYMGATGGLVIPYFYNISNRVGEASVTQSTVERSSLGVFGDISLGYKNIAFIHASGRNDWDSRLAANNRSFFYPSVDASIILSDLFEGIQESTPFSYLKIRGGWSKTGQVSLTNWYGTIPAYVPGAGFPYGSTAGFRLSSQLSNPNLKPEITNEIEAGIEMNFVRNRIQLNVDAYKSNTKNQTIPASISAATGYTSALINAGELEAKGIEADLKFTPLLNLGNLRWDMSVNYTYQTNKVLSIYPGLDQLKIDDGTTYGAARSVSYAVVGQEFPTLMVTDVLRDPQGHIIVDPVTGLPTKNSQLVNAGHGIPNHLLGIINNFSYKGFGLNIVFDYRGGNNILNDVGSALDFTGISEHSALNGRQPFVIPNSVIKNQDGSYTANTSVVVTNAARPFWNTSDYYNVQSTYVTSAAFWKLREVSITYDVPVNKMPSLKFISAAQLSLVGRNLIMWRPVTNVWTDPEFNSNATTSNAVGYTDEDQTPPTRVYGFSIKLMF